MNLFNQSKQFYLSGQLYSQTFSKDLINQFLTNKGIDPGTSHHEFIIQTWHNSIWIKQAGFVSYQEFANFLREYDRNKGWAIWYSGGVKQPDRDTWRVQGTQGIYTVHKFPVGGILACNCMKFKMRQNRLAKECPPLFKALGQIFCHHTKAVEVFLEKEF
jgi:hypothetical protein